MPLDENISRISRISDSLQCPWCTSPKLELKDEAIVCSSCSRVFPRKGGNVDFNVNDSSQTLSPLWREKLEEGLKEYEIHRTYDTNEEITKILDSLIAGSRLDGIILDIGCGIYEEYPPYFRTLSNSENIIYIGLDPLKLELKRRYVFFASIAEKIPFRNNSVDACIFATSFDHFENINNVMREVKRIMKRNGLLFFWVGLSDLEYNMSEAGIVFFKKITTDNNKIKNILRIFLSPVVLILTILSLRENSMFQDKFHFYKYTKSSLMETLKDHGIEIIQTIQIPGTSSILIKGSFVDWR